jgi:hypothetical protein
MLECDLVMFLYTSKHFLIFREFNIIFYGLSLFLCQDMTGIILESSSYQHVIELVTVFIFHIYVFPQWTNIISVYHKLMCVIQFHLLWLHD